MLSGKRLLLLGFIVVLLVVIPLTVYLVQQQQKLNVGATPATTISFSQPSVSTTVGTQFSEDITVNPGGVNSVSFIKLTITYDATKLATAGAGLAPNPAIFTQPYLQGPTYTPTSASVTVSVGSSPQNAISQATKIATITFKALAPTGTTPTAIAFAPDPQTQVLSIAQADQFNENVLVGQPAPANVTITGSAATPTPTPTVSPSAIPSATPTPTPTPTPSGVGSSGGSGTTQIVTVPTATPSATPIFIATPIPTPIPTIAPTGPGDGIASLGTIGLIFTILGAILLFAL